VYLKSLAIENKESGIREIRFHAGLNLIVDETPGVDAKETGNNVGKTTVLMLIDFCLGGEAKDIYTDPESKRDVYALVKDFLIDSEVLVALTLKRDLNVDESEEIRIERNFLPHKRAICRIDGMAYLKKDFLGALTERLFSGQRDEKPTLRQIISHNIRYKDLGINNTLRTLDRFTTDVDYEALHLFMLGCDSTAGKSKQRLVDKLRIETAFKARLEKTQTKSAYEASLTILEREIAALSRRKAAFGLNESFEADLDKLNQIKYKITFSSEEIGRLDLRRSLIMEAERDMESSKSNMDTRHLEQIYSQATARVDGIHKTFEDLLNFHNQMLAQKIKFITRELPELEGKIDSKNLSLRRLLQEEASLTRAIARGESFEELEALIAELNEKYRKKGEVESIVHQLREAESELRDLKRRLDEIDDVLFSETFEQKVKGQVDEFNKFFAEISQSLYGEQYALKVDVITRKKQRVYKFSTFNTSFGSGKKQGEISSFDIAYTLFADQEEIPCLHFLLNDKKELMHNNQLVNIAKLVNAEGIQFVASILRDKLPEELNDESCFVVKLSPEDKLFRIESGQRV
jgi:uncharacterized protein YydD (DUF2326 family)